VRLKAKDKDIVRTNMIANLDVSAIESSDLQPTVDRELNITGAGGFHSGGGLVGADLDGRQGSFRHR